MTRRMMITAAGLLALLAAMLPALRAQEVPPATIEAAVQQLFTATAQAQQNPALQQTIDAAFQDALTATAQAAVTVTATPTAAVTAQQASQPVPEPLLGLVTDLIPISGGTFQMGTTLAEIAAAVSFCVDVQGGNCTLAMGGDSVPPHTVTLDPYRMEANEVTYGQYVAFLNWMGPGSHLDGCDGQLCLATRTEDQNRTVTFDGDSYRVVPLVERLPVTGVTWYGADAYCRAIGRRLPTEAEWELAARGLDGRIYPWGNEWNPALARTSDSGAEIGAVEVGRFLGGISPYGLYDMAGNVAEWVYDWYDPIYYSSPDASGDNPSGPPAGVNKAIRGGSWDARPFFARSVHRQYLEPNRYGAWLGFRCAADAEPVDFDAAPDADITAAPG